MKKLTKAQVKKLKSYWEKIEICTDKYYEELYSIEKNMSRNLGIPNLEFFFCDNTIVGIGDSNRTIKLVHSNELER